MPVKPPSTLDPEIASAEASGPVRLHTWIKLQPIDEWSYCSVCRQVRHPNGKLDQEACRGYYKQSPKPLKTRSRQF